MKTIYTKETLWLEQAPNWNFELNEEQLLTKALEVGFVRRVGNGKYVTI